MVKLVREPLIKRRYKLLTLILITLSISLTILSLNIIYSLYTGLTSYISGGPNTFIIYSNLSRTPFTGIINIENLSKLEEVVGSSGVSPELPIPTYVNGTPMIVRGIYPRKFIGMTHLTLVEGVYPIDPGYSYAVVGGELARANHISVGDTLILISIFNKYYTRVRVVGIVDAEPPYNSEVLVYIGVARHLRGIHGNYCSIIRIKSAPCGSGAEAFREAFLQLGDAVALGVPSEVFEYYSNKIGVSPLILLIGVVPPAILSIIVIKYFVGGLLDEHRDHIDVLRDLGYTTVEIRLSLLTQFLIYMGIAIGTGIVVGSILTNLIWIIGAPSFLIQIPLPSPIPTSLVATLIYLLAAAYYFLHGWVIRE